MGHSTNSNAFRFGVSRSHPIRSSKLLGHNCGGLGSNQFQIYYFFYFINSLMKSLVSNEMTPFLFQFAECRFHDFNQRTHLNLYLCAPPLKTFFRIFSNLFSMVKLERRLDKIRIIKKFIFRKYLRRYINLISSFGFKTFKWRASLIVFQRFFTFLVKRQRKTRNSWLSNVFFYRFFYNFFFLKLMKVLEYEIKNYSFRFVRHLFLRVPGVFKNRKRLVSSFKVNFFFLKRFWFSPHILAQCIYRGLFARRSLGSIVYPFRFFKSKPIDYFAQQIFQKQVSVEGLVPNPFKQYYFLSKLFLRRSFFKKKKSKVACNMFLWNKYRKKYRYFRASQKFISFFNSPMQRVNNTSVQSVRSDLSLGVCVSSSLSRTKAQYRTVVERKENDDEESEVVGSGSHHTFRGLKITACGRFSKRQMAEKLSYNVGSVKFSSPNSYVDFGYLQFALKNSTVGFKIWLSFLIS